MNLHRVLVVAAVGLCAALWTYACGDGATEPPPAPPDPARPATVAVAPATVRLTAAGATGQLTAEVRDQNGNAMVGAAVGWASSAAAVATVNASGLVTGLAEGTATITATAGDARGTAQITVENPDRAALVALYKATDGPNWVNNDNWLTDAPLGEWYGVSTDASGRVVQLSLDGRWDGDARAYVRHGLTGPIPPELGNLANLRVLSLGINALVGPLPPELGRLANLESLNLYVNALTGPVPPELGNLGSLTALALSDNDLEGTIPAELAGLVSLRNLSLGDNDLEGTIPAELGGLSSLEVLTLANNRLAGPVPNSFLQLDRLRHFFLGGNELCVPGTSAFMDWLEGIEYRDAEPPPLCNSTDVAVLTSLFDATDGGAWTTSGGWLGDGAVEEWHGVSADSLGHVTALDLTRNGLAGELPSNLGSLTRMTLLRLGGNALSGRLPFSLASLSLRELHYSDTRLCAPAEASFQAWLSTVPSHEGTGVECALLTDRETLEVLFDATGGGNWTNNKNWLTDAPLEDWHGIDADEEGRVVRLVLTQNGLSGAIPAELSALSKLEHLELWINNLQGRIPPQLGYLPSLRVLQLDFTDLTGPIPPELGNLSELRRLSIQVNDLTGPIPPELANLSKLESLLLSSNRLTGSIPPELANLASMRSLSLVSNDLTGSIPSWLGDLRGLDWLWLSSNRLTGPIPPELGSLSNLRMLGLDQNQLTGSIPPELGDLSKLETLWLDQNQLTGSIPPELGSLSNLEMLELDQNQLTGSIPARLGSLSNVEEFRVSDNRLSGSLPPALGSLEDLKGLHLSNNAGMAGALPDALTSLRRLETLLAGGTDLCAPVVPDFQDWLDGVHKRRVRLCVEGEAAPVYLTQAVQSRDFPVPLVAGEKALLRVFLTARTATNQGIPAVRARFYLNGRETHAENIPGRPEPIPTEVYESSLRRSANAEIPAEVIQPGLEMVIEVDPNGTLDPALGVAKRIPRTDRLAVDVRAMPRFDLTLIPFIWTEAHDSSIVDLIEAMAADPENHELLEDTRTLLPVGDLDVTAHEPVLSSSNNSYTILAATEAIRVMEGGGGYYMGMMSQPVTGPGGVASLPGRASFSNPFGFTIAHELGHNMSLAHAPCGGTGGPDPSFPYPDGSTGAWGYDFRDGGSLVDPRTGRDLMSYCRPFWISDYSFTNALRHRLFDEGAPAVAAAPTRSLLLWGGIDADGEPYLEPTFMIEAPPTLPDSAGEYRISGRTETGTQLFALRFAMPETADGDASSSFAFVLPVRTEWEGNLASISLTGPGGSFTLDGDSDIPMTILRNAQTGQIRGILRDPSPAIQGAADAVGQGIGTRLEVLFSRGIPDAAAWRR